MSKVSPTPVSDHYLAEYTRQEAGLPGDKSLAVERKAALTRFADAGFPSLRDEDWKYTDLRPLSKHGFEVSTSTTDGALPDLSQHLLQGLDCHRLVFVDGRYKPALSQIGSLQHGVTLTNLASALKQPADIVREQLGASIKSYSNALTDLNTAFMTDGLYLSLAGGVSLDKPVHVLFIGISPGMVNLRNLICLARNSEAIVIEHYIGLNETQYFTNCVTEILTDTGSRLSRSKLQQESTKSFHLGNVIVHQQRDSQIRLHGVDLGGLLARNDSNVRLDAPGAETHLYGVYAPTGRQHMDNHTRIDHIQPHCTSREAFRGVLDGHGRGVFNGKIVVHKNAQKTDSQQSSAALLLSKNAEVDAKPELEIYADDVKCAHGSTIGQLDEEAVFYLQSRGLDEAGARSLLIYSFADELIREVRSEVLRRHIETHFLARLPNGAQFKDLL